jgi:hypothetical protein
VVSVLNGAKNIARCIRSVVDQTYPHVELLVMDGGSTDGTVAILESHAGRLAYWESQPDRGICHAWNKAVTHLSGDWVCFLGADDYLWSPDVLERMVPHLASATTRVVYGQVALVNAQSHLLGMVGRPWEDIRRRFLQESVIPHQGVFHHRTLFLRERFDESLTIAGDYDFLLRELGGGEARFVPSAVVAAMQIGGLSSDPARTVTALHEIARASWRFRKGRGILPFFWLWAYAKAWLRRGLGALFGDRLSRGLADLYRKATGRFPLWTR